MLVSLKQKLPLALQVDALVIKGSAAGLSIHLNNGADAMAVRAYGLNQVLSMPSDACKLHGQQVGLCASGRGRGMGGMPGEAGA